MGEAVYLKTSCLKCGGSVEFPDEAENSTVPCPHCGKDLFLHRGVRAVETPLANQPDSIPKLPASIPVLWNPKAAAFWGLIFVPTLDFWLFSPAFGAFLHAKNAENLGRAEEAKANWVWFYVAIVYLGCLLASCFVLPAKAVGLASMPNIVLFSLWYGFVGSKQVKYVNETWQKNYQKKSFGVPLLIAFGFWVVIVGAGYIAIAATPISQENLEAQVRESIRETFLKSADTKEIQIESFSLVHESGTKYKGMLTAQTSSKTKTVEVDVTYDGRTFLWKILPETSKNSPDKQIESAPIQTTPTLTAPRQVEAAPDSAPTPASAQLEAVQSDWNKQEIDATKNGNIAFAVQKILANPNLRKQARTQDPQMIAKAPYNYYGQVVKITGVVGVIQDFPPGSDVSQGLGSQNTSDIVAASIDGTIVEMFCMKSSGNMRVGDAVTLYGYPTGVTDVPNRMGGNDVHLIVVGNDYDDLGIAK